MKVTIINYSTAVKLLQWICCSQQYIYVHREIASYRDVLVVPFSPAVSCLSTSLLYTPSLEMSSSCVPHSSTRPSLMTMTCVNGCMGGRGGGEGKEHGHKHKGHIAKLPSSLQRLIKAQCRTEHTVHETTAGKRDSLPLAMHG